MTSLITSLSIISHLATIVVGTYVAYQSYRGYRRNDSRPMLTLALGLVLMIPIASIIDLVLLDLRILTALQSELVIQTVSISGLIVIFYGLIQT
ncbi:DUF7521 family protein [Halorientalis brevis]|uniref:DUF7521 family protein n=1 Tax=Halorientalis brevis TaxID=1126241 RepID=UPI003D12E35F